MFRVRQQIGCTDEVMDSCIARDFSKEDAIRVAVLDTGIGNHPDLSGRVDAFFDFLHGEKSAYDDSGHGTHVAGCIGGSGKASGGMYKGICPWCRMIVGKVLDRNGDGNMDDMYRGVEWVLQNKDKYRIRVLNISIGIGHIENEKRMQELLRIVDEAWDSGIVVVCAAGNMGPDPMTLSPLGSSKKVITVGCHDGGFFRRLVQTRGPAPRSALGHGDGIGGTGRSGEIEHQIALETADGGLRRTGSAERDARRCIVRTHLLGIASAGTHIQYKCYRADNTVEDPVIQFR